MDERLRFEPMTDVCRAFGISRKIREDAGCAQLICKDAELVEFRWKPRFLLPTCYPDAQCAGHAHF